MTTSANQLIVSYLQAIYILITTILCAMYSSQIFHYLQPIFTRLLNKKAASCYFNQFQLKSAPPGLLFTMDM
jgi:Na+/alanine symporter